MRALLDSPAVRARVHRMSLDEYHRAGETGVLSDNVELLRGIVVTKMPKSPLHELVANKLMDVLSVKIPREYKIRREGPLTLSDSEPEPDISVVQGSWDDWALAHPSNAQLVVEVAVTSELADEEKADIYAEAGIPEYWLIRVADRSVEIFREPTREGYAARGVFKEPEAVKCASIPGVTVSIADILPAQARS